MIVILLQTGVFVSLIGLAAALVMTGQDIRAVAGFMVVVISVAAAASARVTLGTLAAKTAG